MDGIHIDGTRSTTALSRFRRSLAQADMSSFLRAGLVGANTKIDGPYGEKSLIYADYVASGRALHQIERFVLEEVLPFYANSHSEASFCGSFITSTRREARTLIGSFCGATERHAVIFTGSGATSGINRIVKLFGVAEAIAAGKRVRIILGPYEHHSNILPWRESGAEIIELGEHTGGGPDLSALRDALDDRSADQTICSFSAASNITGISSDVETIARMANCAGARIVWDYAGAGPYLPISMSPGLGAEIDAIVVSPHKFIGGPGASGILVLRRDGLSTDKPTWPGGGTVKFVSPRMHDYSDNVESREEAGTPNVIGDIRAALAFMVKDAIGTDAIAHRNLELTQRAFRAWKDLPGLEILGLSAVERLPIFSFRVKDGRGGYVHQQLVTRMLSDRFGIQARGGCACAGPYVHRLLSIDHRQSEAIRTAVLAGDESRKPGFVRLNFSVLLTDEQVEFILDAASIRIVLSFSTGQFRREAGPMREPDVTGFYDTRTGSVQYVVTCPKTKRCAVIDPVLDFDEKSGSIATDSADAVLDYIGRNRLKVEWILDTHPHADHFSAARYLKSKTGAPTAIGEHIKRVQEIWRPIYNLPDFGCEGKQWDRLLADGEVFSIGELVARVLHSPGHTPASVTYVVGDAAFIHDTLLMPDSGSARADFPGGSAASLWQSVQDILSLPDETRLFTGHDYMPGGRSPAWESSVAEQKRNNPHIAGRSREDFIALREERDKTLPMPKLILHALQVNIRGGELPPIEENGRRYLKIPLDALPGSVWGP